MHSQPQQGFTLIEALVGLALAAVALTLGLAIVLQGPRATRRLEAQQEAFRALEGVMEELRGGKLPLTPVVSLPLPPRLGHAAGPIRMVLQVRSTGTPRLLEVTATASYSVLGTPYRRQLSTQAWAPP